MWQKIFHSPWLNRPWRLAALAGITTFLAFPTFEWVPLILLFPLFFVRGALQSRSPLDGFLQGFFVSFVIMLGGFYWVVYVIHEFGHLPWSVSLLLYLGFCGFGALNFPLFTALIAGLQRRRDWRTLTPAAQDLWFALGLPAAFTLIEFLIPKLFPWYIGHSLYRALWINQVVEWTGASFLTFTIFSTGAVLALLWLRHGAGERPRWGVTAIPLFLWVTCALASLWAWSRPEPAGRDLTVALIQANIGSLEKVKARAGIGSKVRYTIDKYVARSEAALGAEPRPDLLVWPETAMPFQITPRSPWSREIYAKVRSWGTPLITGAYAPGERYYERDFNAAFLLEPRDGEVSTQVYRKNILLAFGEFLPLGETFPRLYRMFPQVSNFERGTSQQGVQLQDGTRLGVTICYEAIVPSFYRKVVREGVHAVVNLTNDSWFGPTSEPYQHGALSVFRAIESRAPLLRVANTGVSFTVDHRGRLSEMTGSYEEGTVVSTVRLPAEPPLTFYVRHGDWFAVLCALILAAFGFALFRKSHAPVSR